MATSFSTALAQPRLPSRSDWVVIGIFWCAALPFIFSDYNDVVAKIGTGRFWVLAVWSVLIPNAFALTLVYVLVPGLLFRGWYVRFMLALVATAFFYGIVFEHVSIFIGQGQWPHISLERAFNGIVWLIRSVGVLAAVLTGKHMFESQQRILSLEKERTEAQLRNLKAQIDPHFLFNNLNVLGALIDRSPQQASAYLHRFSALYRYLIRHQDDDMVLLADELAFVQDYMYLMRQRFGRAYELITTRTTPDSLSVFVLPAAIQALIENAVKHNQGDEKDPLLIEMTLSEQSVTVRNARRPKLTPVESTGTGLRNLTTRYALLSDQPVQIVSTANSFSVTLPLLREVGTSVRVSLHPMP